MSAETDKNRIIKLADYRIGGDGKNLCWVTFIGREFRDNFGERRLQLTIEVPDGNVERTISRVREDGGFYVTEDAVDSWFSPWPCAAVHVRWFYARSASS